MEIIRITIFTALCSILLFLTPINVDAKEIDYSYYIRKSCDEIGAEYGICSELLQAIIEKESTNNPDADGNGHIGLMQISEKWHKDRMEKLKVTDLTLIHDNILVGTDYLAELFERHGEAVLVLMAYNMGEQKAKELYRQGIYSKYAISVLERSAELEREHGK